MKKLLLIPIIVLLLSVNAWAIGPATLMMFGGSAAAFCDSSIADCCEDFTTGDTTTRATITENTVFDDDFGYAGNLIIENNELGFIADVSMENAYIIETSCITTETELTIKTTIKFDDVLLIDDSVEPFAPIMIYDSDSLVAQLTFQTDSSGNLDYYSCVGSAGQSGYIDISATVVADTEYTVYLYYKEGEADGEVACKVGDWAEASSVGNNITDDGVASIYFGGAYTEWGDGDTNTSIRFDNFEIFKSDEMP